MRIAYLILLTIAVVTTLQSSGPPSDLQLIVTADELPVNVDPIFESTTVSSLQEPPSVHAGTLTRLSDGRLMAAWFAGTREGAKDVCIYSSIRNAEGWTEQQVIASREQTADDLQKYIRKLGNPLLATAPDGRVWLFYVTVSVGGWSGSSISVRFSDDDGETWSTARTLNCAPFMNISTLVKGRPLFTADGYLLLPVYHECVRKYGELLVLDPDGNVVCKYRLDSDGGTLQPSPYVVDETRIRFLYRQSGHPEEKVLTNEFQLGTGDYSVVTPTSIRNANSAVAVATRWDGSLIMVCNSGDQRERLSVAVSDDGLEWTELRDIEFKPGHNEFSYPYLIRGDQPGSYHLIYTWQREQMKVVTFNEAWLRSAP